MIKNDVLELFAIACDYLQISIPVIDVEFAEMDNQTGAYFSMINQNYYYFRINAKWNKEEFSIEDFHYLLSIIVHECRHFYQLCVTHEFQFMEEFITRELTTKYIENWISYKMEQDAEAIRFLFISDVIHDGKKEPKRLLKCYQYDCEEEINNYIDKNIDCFDSKKAFESLSKFKARVSYIK